MKTELELRQMFKNFSDCYADTWKPRDHEGLMIKGEVIQALTEEKFIEAIKQANFISSNPPVIKSVCVCDKPQRDMGIEPFCVQCDKPIDH